MVKISVIVPVYNVEDYLEKCLNSLINQTFQDIEIICIDDGSTDSSVDILKKYSHKDDRIIVISQENSGPAESRNKGINHANGEYLTFVDSDDWIELDCLEKVYNNAISNNSDVVLFNAIEHRPNNEIFKRIYLPINSDINYDNFVFDYNFNKNLVMNDKLVVWSKLYKTSFLKDNNIYFINDFKLFEDVPFHIETFILAKKISYLYDFLYNYNKLNQNSVQTKKEDFNNRLIIFDIFNKVESILIENNLYEKFNLNFIEFKLLQSYENLKKTQNEFKSGYYDTLRSEFIKMRLNSHILYKLTPKLCSFYINVLNFMDYNKFVNFNHNLNLPFNYINKEKILSKILNFNLIGVDFKKVSEKSIIVSLTSFPDRMHDLQYCLYSLLTQSVKPSKLILWLAEEEFPNKEEDIPISVLNFKKNGLEIRWCNNIKSYKKLIPSLKMYPNSYIVTVDDDIFYPNDWLENIWKSHLKYPNAIISSRSRRIILDDNHHISNYSNWELNEKQTDLSYLNFPTGAGGILYPPNALNENIFNEELFLELSPTGDDLWFWAMAILNKTKIYAIENNMNSLCYVNVAREINILDETTLWGFNQSGRNDDQLQKILNHFPEIIEIIKNSYYNQLEQDNKILIKDKHLLLKHLNDSNNEKRRLQKILGEYTKPQTLKKIREESFSDLTIAIKSPNPVGHHHWGDYFFAVALKKAFKKRGFNVIIHEREKWYDSTDKVDINLLLRGKYKFNPPQDVINIMWNIYDPEKIKKEEYEQYDICFISSIKYANQVSKEVDTLVKPLLQCTDPDVFYQEYDESISEDVLFVGSTRGVYREIIKDIMDTDFDVAVYGRGWPEFIDKKFVKGSFIPNDELHKYYSSCKILLNDHWETMRELDFPSNRLFDALACGTLVISDKFESADTLFERTVVTYQNIEDLNEKLKYYLSHEDERKRIAEKGRKIVLKSHTFDKRVDTIIFELKNLEI